MKKIFSAAIAFVMVLCCLTAFADEAQDPVRDTVVVASLTEVSGNFFNDMAGSNTSDMDVRSLLHGYSTVAFTQGGQYQVDETVIADFQTTEDGDGDKTYEFTLREGLTYCDGTPITAADYVFSVLFMSNPVAREIGLQNMDFSHLIGQAAYANGDKNEFSGVRLLGDYGFSLTVAGENLPYFYELMMVSVTPYPIGTIAPGCGVDDDGKGAYITGDFTAELLQETLFDPATGYQSHPMVTSGPYKLVSYEDGVVHFEINDLYAGNYEGQKPSIRYITLRSTTTETVVDELTSGAIDIVNKISNGGTASTCLEMVNNGELLSQTYPRTGFSFLAFACEQPVTSSVNVRKAVAMAVDTYELTQQFTQGYGLPVYGYYGIGQWMYAQNVDALNELNLYSINLNASRALLVEDGWTLDVNGEEYNEDVGGTRYKDIDGELTPLVIRWARTSSAAADIIQEMLEQNLPQLGVELEVTVLDTDELLTFYYRQTDRNGVYNMFFLATNFGNVFDPYYAVCSDPVFQGVHNTTGIADDELTATAKDMREVESGDTEAYSEKWLAFQQRWSELMPMVPLYSNVYFDFYQNGIYNYSINIYNGWGAAVLYATFEEPVEPETDGAEIIEEP